MLKTYKFRLYPTNDQIEKLNRHFGHTRFVYNYFLAFSRKSYENTETSTNYYDWANVMKKLKKTDKYNWLKEVNSQSLQQSLKNLEIAFKNFFRKQNDFPVFKKKSNNQSFRVPQHIQLYENESNDKYGIIFVPKFKEGIKVRVHRKTDKDSKIKNCTFSKTPSGKYFVSIIFETEETVINKDIDYNNSIGIDMGLKDFVILSDRTKYSSPKALLKYEKQLIHLQRNLSRKKKGSNNRNKARLRVANLYEKINNIREDFLHKLTKTISESQADVFVMEKLNIKGMVKNHHLSKHISDSGWYKFKVFLKYKAERLGKKVLEIGTFEPSSKTCHVCGYKNKELKLSDKNGNVLNVILNMIEI